MASADRAAVSRAGPAAGEPCLRVYTGSPTSGGHGRAACVLQRESAAEENKVREEKK